MVGLTIKSIDIITHLLHQATHLLHIGSKCIFLFFPLLKGEF